MSIRLRSCIATGALVLTLAPWASAQATPSGPVIDDASMYNGGHPCSTSTSSPLPVGPFAHELDAAGVDSDESIHGFDYSFEIWPSADPAAVTHVSAHTLTSGRRAAVAVPDADLTDATTYTWRVQMSDANGTSAWSRSCVFRTDLTEPSAPDLASPNFPAHQWGPAGENVKFTVTPHDPDVVGFVYSWLIPLGVYVCNYDGPAGQLVCPDPLTLRNVVPAPAPGAETSFALDPPLDGPTRLTVEAFDRAGNFSQPVEYELQVSPSGPSISVDGGVACGATATVLVTPNAHVPDAVAYRYATRSDESDTTEIPADSDGTARITIPMPPDHHFVQFFVRSVSSNGFVSTPNIDLVMSGWPPDVASDVYTDSGSPEGGVGTPGAFTFSSPTNFGSVDAYRYRFGSGRQHTVAADSPDESAIVHWTPTRAGRHTVSVTAVHSHADGGGGSCPATYAFDVAGGVATSSAAPSSSTPSSIGPSSPGSDPGSYAPTITPSSEAPVWSAPAGRTPSSEPSSATAGAVANTGPPIDRYLALAAVLVALGLIVLAISVGSGGGRGRRRRAPGRRTG